RSNRSGQGRQELDRPSRPERAARSLAADQFERIAAGELLVVGEDGEAAGPCEFAPAAGWPRPNRAHPHRGLAGYISRISPTSTPPPVCRPGQPFASATAAFRLSALTTTYPDRASGIVPTPLAPTMLARLTRFPKSVTAPPSSPNHAVQASSSPGL